MYNIIAFIIILLSLAGILYIILKKFPSLAVLDIESSPEAKTEKVKEKIIHERLKRKTDILKSKISPFFVIIKNFLVRFFGNFYQKIRALEKKYEKKQKTETVVTKAEFVKQEKATGEVISMAKDLAKEDNFAEAEKKYIEAISLDHKNVEAFKGLAQLYFENRKYNEAKETYHHLLKLNDNDDSIYAGLAQIALDEGELEIAKEDYFNSLRINNAAIHHFGLAEVYKKTNELDQALEQIKIALEIEPANPKYLDFLVELNIELKDKTAAKEAVARLREVNPENKKIDEWEALIKEL